ncbi:hypothetical protein J6590_003828 [Homalodisca vitripennis]|nr:hypothetical protein J6590_003828 [Homalodisca vitripennis]
MDETLQTVARPAESAATSARPLLNTELSKITPLPKFLREFFLSTSGADRAVDHRNRRTFQNLSPDGQDFLKAINSFRPIPGHLKFFFADSNLPARFLPGLSRPWKSSCRPRPRSVRRAKLQSTRQIARSQRRQLSVVIARSGERTCATAEHPPASNKESRSVAAVGWVIVGEDPLSFLLNSKREVIASSGGIKNIRRKLSPDDQHKVPEKVDSTKRSLKPMVVMCFGYDNSFDDRPEKKRISNECWKRNGRQQVVARVGLPEDTSGICPPRTTG